MKRRYESGAMAAAEWISQQVERRIRARAELADHFLWQSGG